MTRATVTPAPDAYVELRCASNFSFLHGASHPEDLAARAAALSHPALALADRDGLHGIVRFDQAAREAGVRPVFGSELTQDDGSRLVLLATSREGYRNLSRLITLGRRDRPKGESAVTLEQVGDHARGLIALTAWTDGRIGRALTSGDHDAARREAGRLCDALGRENVYLEVQRHLAPGEEALLTAFTQLARQVELPLVATNGVLHAAPEGRRAADVLACIRHHVTLQEAGTLLPPNAERHLKSAREMGELFAALPDAVRRTREVEGRCTLRLDDLGYRLPHFPVPPGETSFSYLYRLVNEGAARRYHPMTPAVARQIAHELDVIERLDFAGYFLIVWDVVRFCRENGILCQGRGSAANSAVCYCLGITAVDPVGLDLLFERFLSEDRREPPDIDLDIAHLHREKAIQYVYGKYGRDHAAMTCEVISLRARSALRDVGKAFGLAAAEVDRLSKLLGGRGRIWDEDNAPQLAGEASGPLLREILRTCEALDDFPRHLGIHVGGMVVSRDPLHDLVPVEPAAMPGRTVIQWNKDDAAAVGLVKIDLLGLGMLTLLQEALRLLEVHHGTRLDLSEIPMDDPAVFQLLAEADTVGVFQVESRAQMNTLPRMKPRTFHDLVIEVALIRPGPIQGDMVHPYLRRRSGEEPVTYPHPCLEPILGRTLGIPLFQEQGMKVAVAAGGFTPGEADQLRRAMGHARSHRKMVPLIERLVEGMRARGFTPEGIATVVRQVSSFASFGFPESHAASFALLVVASAWLKVHHPVEFVAALLDAQPMGFYSTATIAEDARRHGVEVLPVDANRSSWSATVETPTREPRQARGLSGRVPPGGNGAVRLGFRSVRGLGEGLRPRMERLERLRPFASLADFVREARLPLPVLETLAAAGVFDCFDLARRQATWEVGRLARAGDMGPLFEGVPASAERETAVLPQASAAERAVLDYRLVGVGTGAHPVSFTRAELKARGALSSEELRQAPSGRAVRSGGLVICRQRPPAAKGTTFLTLEDEWGFVNVIVNDKVYRRHRALVRGAVLLEVSGRLERSGPVVNVVATGFASLPLPAEGFQAQSHDFH